MNAFINQLRNYGEMSPELEREIYRRVIYTERKKEDFLLRAGQRASSLFMLEKGLVRAYFVRNDREVNSWFGMENMVTGSLLPLYTNKVSFENIQFMEDSEVYSISVNDLNELYLKYPELNLIGRKIAEEVCVILEERITSLHTESAEERYHTLISAYPEILQRVSLGHIASHLGITQETLSRIRKRF